MLEFCSDLKAPAAAEYVTVIRMPRSIFGGPSQEEPARLNFPEEFGSQQTVSGAPKRRKWDSGPFGNIEQGVLAIRKVQGPKHGLFGLLALLSFYHVRRSHWWLAGLFGLLAAGATHLPIKPATTELRFAFQIKIQITLVLLQQRNHGQQLKKRVGQSLRFHERQIVG